MAIRKKLTFLLASIASATSLSCNTQSQPNPIAKRYPNDTTGTVNGTVVVLPIPYSVARATIPSQYPILKKQYQEWLPSLPKDMYPAVLNSLLDHDIQMASLDARISDFSRAILTYPFVDRLNDGMTAMTYGPRLLVSDNIVAIIGSTGYGETATPATFDPPCDPYKALSNGYNSFIVTPLATTAPALNQTMRQLKKGHQSPISLEFIKNVTNQPTFGDAPLVCDNFIRFFNTSLERAPYTPTPVKGTITMLSPYAPITSTWTGVYGYQLDTPFIERNFIPCENLKGYSG